MGTIWKEEGVCQMLNNCNLKGKKVNWFPHLFIKWLITNSNWVNFQPADLLIRVNVKNYLSKIQAQVATARTNISTWSCAFLHSTWELYRSIHGNVSPLFMTYLWPKQDSRSDLMFIPGLKIAHQIHWAFSASKLTSTFRAPSLIFHRPGNFRSRDEVKRHSNSGRKSYVYAGKSTCKLFS